MSFCTFAKRPARLCPQMFIIKMMPDMNNNPCTSTAKTIQHVTRNYVNTSTYHVPVMRVPIALIQYVEDLNGRPRCVCAYND